MSVLADLHSHILPGMDDGARDAKESLALLRQEAAQGVSLVALTPHFYPNRESAAHFLKRRGAAFDTLRRALDALESAEREALPSLRLGAEVAWVPTLAEEPGLDELRLNGRGPLLLELPFEPWSRHLLGSLYELSEQLGGDMLIAHLERYIHLQKAPAVQEVLSLGLPVQLSSTPLRHTFARNAILKLLKRPGAWVLASDCHRPDARPADLGEAFRVVERKLGADAAAADTLKERAVLLLEGC